MSQNDHAGKRSLLLHGLVSGKSVAQAAEAAGVSLKTAYRQLNKPEFRERLNQLRGYMLAGATSRMANGMDHAVDALFTLLNDENSSIRIRASRAIIGLGLKMRDAVETNERLTEVERELAERGMS
ncbi:MAG: hypothetical protein EXS09_13180 [Gemmataceae bacterium]|nr:hypothetical protein [Gemmataceae bacterium]